LIDEPVISTRCVGIVGVSAGAGAGACAKASGEARSPAANSQGREVVAQGDGRIGIEAPSAARDEAAAVDRRHRTQPAGRWRREAR
jgi:hypothetical protein